MRSYHKIFAGMIFLIVLLLVGSNLYFLSLQTGSAGRPYRVEIERLALIIEKQGLEEIDLSECNYVTEISVYDGQAVFESLISSEAKALHSGQDLLEEQNYSDDQTFFEGRVFSQDQIFSEDRMFFEGEDSDYVIKIIGNKFYRFDYTVQAESFVRNYIIAVNGVMGIMSLLLIGTLLFIRKIILRPFETLREVPYELSKGNLTIPLKEDKNRFFGRFLWGINLLRENMELQKQRELELQKEKKMLILSVSHDIKTPLSAIKLYAKALSKGLYTDTDKQTEIAENINARADEIEGFVAQIITASREDFLNLEVNYGEFYLSELVNQIRNYYKEKLTLVQIAFAVGKYSDCILNGDIDRSVEVLQNIMENAVKYGDGHMIEILFSEEEDCRLITVRNSGCTLSETDLPHIFDSFWRGANSANVKGSGLGLYICRQLMRKMNGEIYAEIKDGWMSVTVVFEKAG